MTTDAIKSRNIVWHQSIVSRKHREEKNQHKSVVLWFTGLSGSGKSTLAHALEKKLYRLGLHTFVLDGDNIRHGLNKDLGFDDRSRTENIRRVGEISKLMLEAGIITLTAFISPFKEDRAMARTLMPKGDFIEIHCCCPIEICETRDVKGLYQKARKGEIKSFTGISSAYEPPDNPELKINTDKLSLEESIDQILNFLITKQIIDNTNMN